MTKDLNEVFSKLIKLGGFELPAKHGALVHELFKRDCFFGAGWLKKPRVVYNNNLKQLLILTRRSAVKIENVQSILDDSSLDKWIEFELPKFMWKACKSLKPITLYDCDSFEPYEEKPEHNPEWIHVTGSYAMVLSKGQYEAGDDGDVLRGSKNHEINDSYNHYCHIVSDENLKIVNEMLEFLNSHGSDRSTSFQNGYTTRILKLVCGDVGYVRGDITRYGHARFTSNHGVQVCFLGMNEA